MMKRTTDIVVDIAAAVEKVWRQNCHAVHIKEALAKCQSIFKQSSEMSLQDWFLSKDNTSVHMLPQSRSLNGGVGVKTIRRSHYSPAFTTAVFFLFQRVKLDLAGLLLSQSSLKTNRDGFLLSPKMSLLQPFGVWIEHSEKVFELAVTKSKNISKL
jgi:hypothetical protein